MTGPDTEGNAVLGPKPLIRVRVITMPGVDAGRHGGRGGIATTGMNGD